jgi:hypothetical protein
MVRSSKACAVLPFHCRPTILSVPIRVIRGWFLPAPKTPLLLYPIPDTSVKAIVLRFATKASSLCGPIYTHIYIHLH